MRVGVSRHRRHRQPRLLRSFAPKERDARSGLRLRCFTYCGSTQREHLRVTARGVRPDCLRLYCADFARCPLPLPPPDEQAAIVRFLDYANGRLERAIRAKRKLIALLNEQKQAIIHRAVTRGLDPDVPLKPSGIPWLGDVPEEWEVRRLVALAANQSRLARPVGCVPHHGPLFVRIGNLSRTRLRHRALMTLRAKRFPPLNSERLQGRAQRSAICYSRSRTLYGSGRWC